MAKSRNSGVDRSSLLYAVYEELLVGLAHKNFSSAELLSIAEGLIELGDAADVGLEPERHRSGYYSHDVDTAFQRMPWAIVAAERIEGGEECSDEGEALRVFKNISDRWSIL